MKLNEMLKERERLREIDAHLKDYDHLKNVVEQLKRVYADNDEPYECETYPYQLFVESRNGNHNRAVFTLRTPMLEIIINALQAEISRMENE